MIETLILIVVAVGIWGLFAAVGLLILLCLLACLADLFGLIRDGR